MTVVLTADILKTVVEIFIGNCETGSQLPRLVYSFSQLYFTINLEAIFYLTTKKCRIYAAFGVSQTPRNF